MAKIFFLFLVAIGYSHSLPTVIRSPKQNEVTTVTLVNESTPSVVATGNSSQVIEPIPPIKEIQNLQTQQPELVPTVVDPNPTTTTVKPVPSNSTTPSPDDDDESSEEDEDQDQDDTEPANDDVNDSAPDDTAPDDVNDDDTDSDPDTDPEDDQADDSDEDSGDSDSENNLAEKDEKKPEERSNEEVYIPGYITEHGELLVPIDTVQRDLQYTIIEDPSYKQLSAEQSVPNSVAAVPKIPKQFDSDEDETSITKDKNSVVFESKTTSDEDVDADSDAELIQKPTTQQRPPLAAIPSVPTNEDDELDAKISAGGRFYLHDSQYIY